MRNRRVFTICLCLSVLACGQSDAPPGATASAPKGARTGAPDQAAVTGIGAITASTSITLIQSDDEKNLNISFTGAFAKSLWGLLQAPLEGDAATLSEKFGQNEGCERNVEQSEKFMCTFFFDPNGVPLPVQKTNGNRAAGGDHFTMERAGVGENPDHTIRIRIGPKSSAVIARYLPTALSAGPGSAIRCQSARSQGTGCEFSFDAVTGAITTN